MAEQSNPIDILGSNSNYEEENSCFISDSELSSKEEQDGPDPVSS